MERPYISVIIPVYNAERYLSRCLNSILKQTMAELEIICVNDGSTDGSAALLDEYAHKDDRITILHKDNGGLVSARKVGVAAATGRYIGFVDADDWIAPEMYEELYRKAIENDADMVTSGYILEGNYISMEYDSVDPGVYASADEKRYLLDHLIFNMEKDDLGLRGSLCCKIFRREKYLNVQAGIPEGISYCEDKMAVLRFALDCDRVYVIRDAWYHYMINPASMSHKANPDYLNRMQAVYSYLISLYDHPDFTDEMRRQAELYITQQLLKGINSRMGFSIRNLMWIGTGWMYKIPDEASILLCGAGELGETYMRQILHSNRLRYVGCIDARSESSGIGNCKVTGLDTWQEYEFDYVVVTYKYSPKAEETRRHLLDLGIDEEKILWFEQKEIFWDYADAIW